MNRRLAKSFGAKLALGFIGVALVAILVVIVPITLLAKHAATEQLRGKARLYARLIEPQLRTVIAFDDTLTAREVFAPFAADHDLAGVAIYANDGRVIEGRGEYPPRVVSGQVVAAPPGHRLLVITPVVSREGPKGMLAIELSTDGVIALVRRNTLTATSCAAAALVLAALIALLFGRSVSVRLRRISRAALKVAEGDLTRPNVRAGAADEIGHLVDAFNMMVEKLRQQFAERRELAETEQSRLEEIVSTRTAQLEESREQYRLIAESTNAIPFTYLPARRSFAYIGPQVQKTLGHAVEKWTSPDFLASVLLPDQATGVHQQLSDVAAGDGEFECALLSPSGAARRVRWVVTRGELRGEPCLRGLLLDITQQRKLESDLQQAQKLESVGRLASGVAHEINTPVQFVRDNTHFLRDSMQQLFGLIEALRLSNNAVLAGSPSTQAAQAAASEEGKVDLAYLTDDMPKAFIACDEGLTRVATIVRSMKEFAHPDSNEMSSVDLNRAIASTIVIASNEYKYVADVETKFDSIPNVLCYAGDVNQAVLNIIVNAAHAIGDIVEKTGGKGRITVTTRQDGDDVLISISDTGGGIPEHIRARIFDPFFTTKTVGKGTGQGLAIARSVIVDKHGGQLTLETEVGVGSTFVLRLPVDGKPVAASAAKPAPGIAA